MKVVARLPKHLAIKNKFLIIGESKHKTMNITLPSHSGLFNKLLVLINMLLLSASIY